MEALITITGFLIVTAISVIWHLRRSGAAASSGAPAAGPPCPRCRAPVPAEAESCPACGVPRQIFEVVTAKTVEPAAADVGGNGNSGGKLHAMVRADRCVGCGTCVAACPEPGAIALVGKVATVDKSLCVGHGECVQACPVGAVSLAGGAAVQRVEVPEVDAGFQSNVAGLYIVGELGGRGLIKNAINEGKIAAEDVARALPPETPGAGQDDDVLDLVVVGSGPAGLSAGLEAHRAGLRYVVLEQGTLADTIRKYPRRKLLLAEPVRVPLYGDLWVSDASKETLLRVWETIIADTGLRVLTEHRVETVVREGGSFRVVTGRGDFRARRVVLALGRRGTPRRLGVPGEDLAKVTYDIVEMEVFAGRRVLVVGGGDSAVESALGLANQVGTEVHLSYRGVELSRVKERNRAKFEKAVAAGKLVPIYGSRVVEIREEEVVLEVSGESRVLPNDHVIIRIGGDPPFKFLERVGVRLVQKDVPLAIA